MDGSKKAEIVDPADISYFSPNSISDGVRRDSILDTIDLNFRSGEKVIVVNGDSGMGKSVLLSQFLERHKENSISIFIDPVNKQSYCEENIVRDLYQQASFFINGVVPEDIESADQARLNTIFFSMKAALKKESKNLFLIIDGLDEIPAEDDYIVGSILDLMPFSMAGISFLFSSESNFLEKRLTRQKYLPIQMVLYTFHEASAVLSGVATDDVKSFLEVFQGVPEVINTIKRLIDGGMEPTELLQNYCPENHSLFKVEWEKASTEVNENIDFFGLITFSIHLLNFQQLADILQTDVSQIKKTVASVGFIEEYGDTVRFRSNGIKTYAAEQLEKIKVKSLNYILTNLSQTPEDKKVLSVINSYHDALGDYSAITQQLSNSNISLMFKETNSVNEIVKQIKHAQFAATKISSETETLRFSHARSIISGMTTSKLLESELMCHLSENDYDSALGLVASSKVLEERLQLLGVIATHQKQKKDEIDEEIERRIKADFGLINSEHLGIERTIDLASGLFLAFPEMSLSLINQIDSLNEGGGNKADYAFYRLSMETLKKNSGSVDELLDGLGSLDEQKKNALSLLGLFRKGTPADKIISKLDEYDKSGDAIFILQNWINAFPKDEGTFQLAEKLLSLIITSTDFHENATLYADVSSAIQYMSKKRGLELLKKINPKLDYLKKSGPTIDFVRLQINIVLFEAKYEIESDNKAELIRFILSDIEDVSIKLSSLCLISKFSTTIPVKTNKYDLNKEKEEAFLSLIRSTADHIPIIKDALLREVEVSIDNTLLWVSKLNTRPRRDYAQSLVIIKACELKKIKSINRICEEVRKISNKEFKNNAIEALFDYCIHLDSMSKSDFKKLIKLRNKVKNNFILCKINTSLLLISEKVSGDCSEQIENISNKIEIAWNEIDGDWHKIDIAYEIHNRLIEFDRTIAISYKDKAVLLRENNAENNKEEVDSQLHSIDLAIRSFYFLCRNKAETVNDISQLTQLVCNIQGKIPRIKELARLASALYLTGKMEALTDLMEEHLIPDVESLGSFYSEELAAALKLCAPIIYVYSNPWFERILGVVKEDVSLSDKILSKTQRFLLNKVLIGDPFEPIKNFKHKLSAREIESHFYLVKKMREDNRVYFSLARVVKIIVQGKKNNTYTRPQLAKVGSDIEEIISTSFESTEYIKHDGYKICCKALLFYLNGEKNKQNWEDLVSEAVAIPVDSDQIIVLGEIIECMPSSLADRKKSLLSEAVDITEALPSNLDKISRYEYLAEIGQDVDKQYVKKFVRKAVLLSTTEDTAAYEERRLSLIDSLYSMDKDFATGLSGLVDDDPARKKAIEDNIARKELSTSENNEFNVSNDDIKSEYLSIKYPKHLWGLLGKLNATNHVPLKEADYQKFLDSTSRYSFSSAYPMLSYYIHTKGSFCGEDKRQTISLMRPIFDTLLRGAILFSNLCDTKQKVRPNSSVDDNQIVFGASDDNAVTQFVKDWVSGLKKKDEKLILIDPYFTQDDMEFIGEIISKDPNFNIRILTSYSNMEVITNKSAGNDIRNIMQTFWNDNICSDSMPYIDVVFCGVDSKKGALPIHDRWLLSGKEGLRFGCSINGIPKKISAISKMRHDEVLDVESKINGFLYLEQRMYDGERILSTIVSV